METRNSCYTYFRIIGEFNPQHISDILNLSPERSWKIGDLSRHGEKYDFANWEIGRCDEYDEETSNQMRKTISSLLDKVDLLNKIREENDVQLYLEVVPHIYSGDVNPCLSPALDIIDFCHATRTEIDIDMYIYNSSDE